MYKKGEGRSLPHYTIINQKSKHQTRFGINALTKLLSAKEQKVASNLLMINSLGHAETGILADIDFVKHIF